MTEPIKKLYRSASKPMLGGVCAGLGEYLGIDPTVVRVITVLAAFLSAGTAGLVYLAMWLIIPQEPIDRTPQV
jgi:phage shock protein PspC (stress-responsive transcriptional regulator)